MVSCKLLGITGPRLLFSCFQSFGQDYVITGRYPQLKNLDKQHIKGLGIRIEFEDYIKKYGPCVTSTSAQVKEESNDKLTWHANNKHIDPHIDALE